MRTTKTFSLVLNIIFLFILTFIISGCTHNEVTDTTEYIEASPLTDYFDPSLPEGTIEFTNLILDIDAFNRIIPLGQINPPGHTFPTDHIYFVLSKYSQPVYAPVSGKVLFIDEPGDYGDRAIRIGVTKTMSYYLGHILISDGLEVGDMVVSGEQIGVTGNTSCVDFGVLNLNIVNQFLNTNYPRTTIYGDKPLSFYTEPLKTQLYSLVLPHEALDTTYTYDGGVTDGTFVYDINGTLSGNWFRESYLDENDWYEWADTLSFCYDVYYTDQIRIAIGTWYNAFAINNDDSPLKPEEANTASGIITYYLYNANNTTYGLPTDTQPMAVMLVQMISDTRIKVEIFDFANASGDFSSAATFYVR